MLQWSNGTLSQAQMTGPTTAKRLRSPNQKQVEIHFQLNNKLENVKAINKYDFEHHLTEGNRR